MQKRTKIVLIFAAILLIAGVVLGISAFGDNNSFMREYGQQLKKNAENKKGEKVVLATYNKDFVVTQKDLDDQKALAPFLGEDTAASDLEVVNRIVGNELLLEEAKQKGYTFSQKEVEDYINALRTAVKEQYDGIAQLTDYLDGMGISLNDYLQIMQKEMPDIMIRRQLQDEFVTQYYKDNGIDQTGVTPEASDNAIAAYRAYRAELVAQHQADIVYSDVLLSGQPLPEPSPETPVPSAETPVPSPEIPVPSDENPVPNPEIPVPNDGNPMPSPEESGVEP